MLSVRKSFSIKDAPKIAFCQCYDLHEMAMHMGIALTCSLQQAAQRSAKLVVFLFGVRSVCRSDRGDALVSFGSSSSAASMLACIELPEHVVPTSQLSADARARHQAV